MKNHGNEEDIIGIKMARKSNWKEWKNKREEVSYEEAYLESNN